MTEETLADQIDKLSKLFDYIEKQYGSKTAGNMCTHLGIDNPYIAIKYSEEKWKELIDKYFRAREILTSGK